MTKKRICIHFVDKVFTAKWNSLFQYSQHFLCCFNMQMRMEKKPAFERNLPTSLSLHSFQKLAYGSFKAMTSGTRIWSHWKLGSLLTVTQVSDLSLGHSYRWIAYTPWMPFTLLAESGKVAGGGGERQWSAGVTHCEKPRRKSYAKCWGVSRETADRRRGKELFIKKVTAN